MRRLFEGGAYLSNWNWQLKSLLHLGQIVITFRTSLHLGQIVITFRTSLHLGQNVRALLHFGPFITFRPSSTVFFSLGSKNALSGSLGILEYSARH